MGWKKENTTKSGVYAYLDTATETTTPLSPNEFTQILGTFNNDPFENFSVGIGAIVYDGIDNVAFEIDWHASFQLASANKTVHFGVAINGVTITVESTGVVGTFAKNNNQTYAVSGTQVVILKNGDTIQLQTACSAASTVITVNHFTTTISRFFINN